MSALTGLLAAYKLALNYSAVNVLPANCSDIKSNTNFDVQHFIKQQDDGDWKCLHDYYQNLYFQRLVTPTIIPESVEDAQNRALLPQCVQTQYACIGKPFTSFCIKDILGKKMEENNFATSPKSDSLKDEQSSSPPFFLPILEYPSSRPARNSTSEQDNESSLHSRNQYFDTVRSTTLSTIASDMIDVRFISSRSKMEATKTDSQSVKRFSNNDGCRIVRPWASPSKNEIEQRYSCDIGCDRRNMALLHSFYNADNTPKTFDSLSNNTSTLTKTKQPDDHENRDIKKNGGFSPLDALMVMTQKKFDGSASYDTPGEHFILN